MNTKGGKKYLIATLVLLSGFLSPLVVRGKFFAQASEQTVFISEICWMGSEESANDEWIELYNPSSQNVNLDGWLILADDGQPEITLEGVIPAQGYFLLERTNDDSAPKATADLIYSGSLANSGEDLNLFDDDDNLIDEIKALEAWPAGDNETKATMQLVAGNWITAESTPKKDNYELLITKDELTEDALGDSDDSGSAHPEVSADKKGKMIINEIYPNVVGSDRTGEFIELMNIGQTAVDLEGWRIEVDEKVYEFGKLDLLYEIQFSKTVGPGKQFAIFRPQSRLVLNNSGGEIKLFKPSRKTAEDTLEYPPAPEGYSYVNTDHIDLDRISTSTREFFLNSSLVGDWIFSAQISPGSNNQVKSLNTAPKAFFSVPEKVEPKKEIFFDASDTIDEEGDDLRYSWDFGDGTEVGIQEARHTFLKPGEYEVTLKVADNHQESLFSKMVRVGMVEAKDSGNDIKEEIKHYWFEDIEPSTYSLPDIEELETKSVSIKEAREFLGQEIITKGVAAVEPGVIGTQYFYIVDNYAGIKVYNYKKDFPKIKAGDLLEIKGEVVDIRDEMTIKTQDLKDIRVLEKDNELPIKKASSEDLLERNSGRLLEVEGKVVKKDLPRIYMNDGFGEATIYLKDNLEADTKDIKEDGELKVKGVLGIVSGDLVILPRYANDLYLNSLSEPQESGQVLGQKEVEEWELPARSDKKDLLKYVLAAIVAGSAVIVIVFQQKKKAAP